MFKYELHLHTAPVSKCARATVRETLEFYKSLGYDGVFITNHFLDGNINISHTASYEEKINFYFSDYEEGVKLSSEIGIKVFLGIEISYGGTDFLVFGLGKQWFLEHPEIMDMKKSVELPFFIDNGGYVIQAHPFREASYIDHIRLFPRCVNAVEVINANRNDFENKMAKHYAQAYGLTETAGSDNHTAANQKKLAGMMSDVPVANEKEFIDLLKAGSLTIFTLNL